MTLTIAALLGALALVVAMVAPQTASRPHPHTSLAAAQPHAVPSTTQPLVAFTSDYGQIVHDNGGVSTPGGFDTGDASSVYEGEAAFGNSYNALVSTRGGTGEAQVYVRHETDDPVQLTCDDRIKSHPVVTTYTGAALPGSPLLPLYLVVAYSVRASYASNVSYIEVDRYLAGYQYQTGETQPPIPTPNCATNANITHVRLAAQTGDNEWPTFASVGGAPIVVYSSTRDNPLGDIYVQGIDDPAATRLTNGTAAAVANTQPTVDYQDATHEVVYLTTTAFRPDGSLGTFVYNQAAPALQTVTSAWEGDGTPPQSSQPYAAETNAAPNIYYRSTDTDPFGDIYLVPALANASGSGYYLPVVNAQHYAGAPGTADSDPGVDLYSTYYSDPSHDRSVNSAAIDAVVADDPTSRGTIIEKDNAAATPSRYDTSAPAYSPDGTKLVYSQANSTAAQIRNGATASRSIWIADSDGTNPVRLTQVSGGDVYYADTNPTFSPDGKTVAFQRISVELLAGGGQHVTQSVIETVPADASAGPQQTAFAQPDLYLDGSPSYSPNGTDLTMSRTPVADVTGSVEPSAITVADGGTVTIRPTLTNNGAAPALNAKVIINFSTNNLIPTATGSCAVTATTPTFQVTCTAPSLGAGLSNAYSFTAVGNGSTAATTDDKLSPTATTTSTENDRNNDGTAVTITVGIKPPPGPHVVRPRLSPPATGAAPTPSGPLAREGVRAVAALTADQPSQIWVANATSGNSAALAPPACGSAGLPRTSCAVSGRTPAWSPDGTHIAFEADGTVYDATLDNVDGDAALEGASVITPVTGFASWQGQSAGASKPTGSRGTLSTAIDPAWSPDGQSLLVAGQPAGMPDRSGIYRVTADGATVTLVAQGAGPESEPAVQPEQDLSITLASTPTVPASAPTNPAGDATDIYTFQETTLTATVTNTGNSRIAPAVRLTIPAGMSVQNPPVGCVPTTAVTGPGTLTCSLGVIGVGNSATLTVIATADGTDGNRTFTADAYTNVETTTIADTASTTVAVRPRANLDTTLTANPQTARTGNDITFTATVINNGAGNADGSTVRITVPQNVKPPTAITPTGGTSPSCTFTANATPPAEPGGTLTCDFGTLAPKGTGVVTFKETSDVAYSYLFESRVSTTTAETDTNNEYANVAVRWTSHAGLSVLIAADPLTITLGEPTTVTATVTNLGPDTAGVPEPGGTLGPVGLPPTETTPFATLTIQLPTGMSVPAPPTGCTIAGTTMTCELAPFASGETRTFTFDATGLALGDHTYDAAVASNTDDDDLSDNTDSTTVTVVQRRADLTVTITPSRPSVSPGTAFSAIVTVRNSGPYNAENTTLDTDFDSRLQAVSSPTCAAGGSTCALGTLAPGASTSYVVTLNAQHDGTPPASYIADMSAKVATTSIESDTTNNSDQARVRVIEKPFVTDVAVTVTLPHAAYVGGTVKATIRVSNLGPQPATKVRLTTNVPARLQAISYPLCVTGTNACQLGTLAAGASRVFELQFTPKKLKPARNYGAIVAARVTTTTRETEKINNFDSHRLPVHQPRIRLLPPIGPPGFVTLVFGEELPPGAKVSLRWLTGITAYGGPYTVDPDGTMTAPMQVVRHDELGRRRVILYGKPGLFGKVSAIMLVVPSQGSPPRFFGRG